MDSLYSIFCKYWATYKFPDIALKINRFQEFYADKENFSNQLLFNFVEKSTTMNPCKKKFKYSLAQILPEKFKKMFLPKKLGFIDVLRTVPRTMSHVF